MRTLLKSLGVLAAWTVMLAPVSAFAHHVMGGKLPVTREEPLKRELEDFVRAVRDRRRPIVAGVDGLRALQLAQAIAGKMETV